MRSLSSIKKKKFKVVTEEERPKSAITKYPYISTNQISKINLKYNMEFMVHLVLIYP